MISLIVKIHDLVLFSSHIMQDFDWYCAIKHYFRVLMYAFESLPYDKL